MSGLARFLSRFAKTNPGFAEVVDTLRMLPKTKTPISAQELVLELEELVVREPATESELTQLEAELFVLGERTQSSGICDDIPHFVWHFLSDADIRFKEPKYAAGQRESLCECIEQIHATHITQTRQRPDTG